jgi:hypothetical protein
MGKSTGNQSIDDSKFKVERRSRNKNREVLQSIISQLGSSQAFGDNVYLCVKKQPL